MTAEEYSLVELVAVEQDSPFVTEIRDFIDGVEFFGGFGSRLKDGEGPCL